jgi:hypothetical protein
METTLPEKVAAKRIDVKPVSFKLSPKLIADIDAISENENRSRTGTVRVALQAFVRARTTHKGKRA